MTNSNIRMTFHSTEGIKKKVAKTGLISNLPIIKKYTIKDFKDDSGWIDYYYFSFNKKDVKLKMMYNNTDWEYTPKEMYDLGMTEPSNYGLYLDKYDVTNNLYTIRFDPAVPMSFRDGLKFEYIKTSVGVFNIIKYRIECFVFYSSTAYVESILEPLKTLKRMIK